MEACSEGEKKKPPEGENKTKRKMKTASQLEILEKTYADERYPSEALRAELSARLGLSDRQLQMWFCHRRLKDRKAPAAKKLGNESPPGAVTPASVGDGFEHKVMGDGGHARGSVSGLRPYSHMDSRRVILRPGMAFPSIGGGLPAMESYHESHQSIAELKAIAFVKAQLGEPLREDGPILGMEFDPLPPGAFGAPIGPTAMGQQRQPRRPFEAKIYERLDKGVSRTLHEYKFIPEQPTVRNETYDYERVNPYNQYGSFNEIPHARTSLPTGRRFRNGNEIASYGYGCQNLMPGLNLLSQQGRQNHLLPSASGQNDDVPWKNTYVGAHPVTQIDSALTPSDAKVIHEEEILRFQRKRKNEEARVQRELEAQEKRIRKDLKKQDILRRKREEQVRKEMERHERERRKEEERLLRERQREEERYQREQRRELDRREKILQKESIRAEKRKQKDELRREKEAARIKAANERAIARRMVKESMELIEDERLEMMELAASEKGLSSILSLDCETLQNLEIFKDRRTPFPPKSVLLKRPFSIQPWLDSEENIGNLLMVWRFLISFADVLGIWPFTLDEFLQSFHDHDPRLLGEIHIALLRSIIKDIEDVARTTTGVGSNHNSAVNPCGGHPQVVEGAYVWGFDIRNWQRLLNPLTWPEIMRQFALSAGFGPQLKKRVIEQVYPCDNNQGIDGEDIISNLRSGAAVENAVAIMQEKGLSKPRRSRHRLTPGTVKFAVFHVLSLEGSKGLTILEAADKIQKSGLRDLTTSKTPEASIAAALSRDTKLFERTAPSTYCLRPAYRKDPADGEAILSAARERIRIFKKGLVDAEEPDDGERDDDSEIDMAEDHGVDDLCIETNNKKQASELVESSLNTVINNKEGSGEILQTHDDGSGQLNEGLTSIISEDFNQETKPDLEDTGIDESNPGEPWVEGLMEGEYSDLSVEERLNALVALIGVAIEGNSIRVVLEERLEAANALKKQIWTEVQLDRHRIKEDCFFKMQSCPCVGNKNEQTPTISSMEIKQSPLHSVDDRNDKTLLTLTIQQVQLNDLLDNQTHLQSVPSEVNMQTQDSAVPDNYSYQQFGCGAEKSRSNFKSYIGQLAEETYIYRSLPLGLDRRRNRYWQFITCASQNDPGCGRVFVEMHNGCWRLIDSEEGFNALKASLDVRGIRESHLLMMLQRIEMSFKESVRRNNLRKGDGDPVNTEAFQMNTEHDCCASICGTNSNVLETSTSFVVQLGRNDSDKQDALRRYRDFERWMLMEGLNSSVLYAMRVGKRRCSQLMGVCDYCHEIYLSEEIPCPSCCSTLHSCKSNLSSSEDMAKYEGKLKSTSDYIFNASPSSLRMRLLKVMMSIVEVYIPEEALNPLWTDSYRKSWSIKLHDSSSAKELLEILTILEGAIKRDYLTSNFKATSELLGSIFSSGVHSDSIGAEKIPVLPWVPHTTAAVVLRLMELDISIFYTLEQKLESEKDKTDENVMKFPSKCASAKNAQVAGAAETSHLGGHSLVDLGAGFASYSRGQRSRGQGRGHSRGIRSQGRVINSRPESKKKVTATSSRRLGQGLRWKGKSRGRGGHCRARRSIRSKRQNPATKEHEIAVERDASKEESAGIFVGKGTNEAESVGCEMETAENGASSSGRSDSEEDDYQVTGDEYDYLVDNNDNGYNRGGFSGKSGNIVEGINFNLDDEEDGGGFSGKSDDLIEGIDFDVDDGEEEDIDEDEDDDEQVDVDVGNFTNGDSDIGENGEDAEQNLDADGLNSPSSEYSD